MFSTPFCQGLSIIIPGRAAGAAWGWGCAELAAETLQGLGGGQQGGGTIAAFIVPGYGLFSRWRLLQCCCAKANGRLAELTQKSPPSCLSPVPF